MTGSPAAATVVTVTSDLATVQAVAFSCTTSVSTREQFCPTRVDANRGPAIDDPVRASAFGGTGGFVGIVYSEAFVRRTDALVEVLVGAFAGYRTLDPRGCGWTGGQCTFGPFRLEATAEWLMDFVVSGGDGQVTRSGPNHTWLTDLTSGQEFAGNGTFSLLDGHAYRLRGYSRTSLEQHPEGYVFVDRFHFGSAQFRVPEPASGVLLATMLVAFAASRCRRAES